MFFQHLFLAISLFVSPVGNDAGPGSMDEPFLTIAHAINVASRGDVIFLRDGVYPLPAGLVFKNKNDITLKNYPDESPVLNYAGPDTYALLIGPNSTGITVSGLTMDYQSGSPGNLIGIDGDDIAITYNQLYFSSSVVKYDGIKVLSNANTVQIAGNYIHDVPNQCIDAVAADRLNIQQNILEQCQHGVVLKGGSAFNFIERNTIIDTQQSAIIAGGTTAPQFNQEEWEAFDTVIASNFIFIPDGINVGGGILFRGAWSSRADNNTIIGPGVHIKSGGDPATLGTQSKYIDLNNNIIWSRGNDGILVVDPNNLEGIYLAGNCYWTPHGSGQFKIDGRWHSYEGFKMSFQFDYRSIYKPAAYQGNFEPVSPDPCAYRGVNF